MYVASLLCLPYQRHGEKTARHFFHYYLLHLCLYFPCDQRRAAAPCWRTLCSALAAELYFGALPFCLRGGKAWLLLRPDSHGLWLRGGRGAVFVSLRLWVALLAYNIFAAWNVYLSTEGNVGGWRRCAAAARIWAAVRYPCLLGTVAFFGVWRVDRFDVAWVNQALGGGMKTAGIPVSRRVLLRLFGGFLSHGLREQAGCGGGVICWTCPGVGGGLYPAERRSDPRLFYPYSLPARTIMAPVLAYGGVA